MPEPTESAGTVEWHLGHIFFHLGNSHDSEYALIVLNQPLLRFKNLEALWRNASYRVAADAGADRLRDVVNGGGVSTRQTFDNLDVIIGDLDSISPAARSYFTSTTPPTKVIHDPDQYSTDFTKAVNHVRSVKPGMNIAVFGGLGGRVDHGLSQLHHLYLFQEGAASSQGKICLLTEESLTFLLRRGAHQIWVREIPGMEMFGEDVGILPIKEASIISTKGLEWDVSEWRTEFGGQVSTSNHVLPETKVVHITTTADVIFTIALA